MIFMPYVAKDRVFRNVHMVNEIAKLWYDGSPNQSMPERKWYVSHIKKGMTAVDCGVHHA
jgi:hypothetical protein